MDYDTIIVGGGSAGSVLAHRLSSQSAHKVLLCEAGPDTPPGAEPAEILDSYPGVAYFDRRFHWTDLKVTTQVISHNNPHSVRLPARTYEQARVLGGGSAINGQLANRGAPADYDEWQDLGAEGWGWNAVLPYFKRVERDLDFDGPLHGKDGLIPVRRVPPEHWNGFVKGAAQAFADAGHPYIADQNGEFRDGYFPLAISNQAEARVSAAMGYLDAATRRRANLTILTDTSVQELLFDGARCVGIRARTKGEERTWRAREVILCAGAIHSPAFLMRAGIGPEGHLRDLGIQVRLNRPGVGRGLMDHPAIALSSFMKPHARTGSRTRRHILLGLRYSSAIEGAPQGDMFVGTICRSAWHAVGQRIGTLIVWVNKTYSATGEVRLASPDWRAEPAVAFNLLSDRRDALRLMDGFRRLGALQLGSAMQAVSSNPFPASYSERMRKLGRVNARNRIATKVISLLLDGPAALRRALIDNFIVEGFTFAQLMVDDDALEEFVRQAAIGVWHASCTCRMGSAGDAYAVTDPAGRVRGIDGLRVVDASIFPGVPRANTNFPTLMAAEKIADAIAAGR